MTQAPTDTINNPSEGVGLADLFLLFKRKLETELNVSMPATVTTYNPATRLADVVAGYVPVIELEGIETPTSPVLIRQVPVAQLGSISGSVTVPIAPGTTGNLIFSDRCLQQWVRTIATAPGTVNPLTVCLPPTSPRTHALGDAVFYPGLTTLPNAAADLHDNFATVIEADLIKLGKTALAESVIKGTTYIAAENALSSALLAWWTSFQAASAPLIAAPDPSGALLWTFMNAMVGPTTTLLNAIGVHIGVTAGAAPTVLSTKVKVDT